MAGITVSSETKHPASTRMRHISDDDSDVEQPQPKRRKAPKLESEGKI